MTSNLGNNKIIPGHVTTHDGDSVPDWQQEWNNYVPSDGEILINNWYRTSRKPHAAIIVGNGTNDVNSCQRFNNAPYLISRYSMPSGKAIVLYYGTTQPASGWTYTCPCDGTLFIRGKANAVNQFIAIMRPCSGISDRDVIEASVMWSHSATADMYVSAQFKEGEVATYRYTAGGSSTLSFILFMPTDACWDEYYT